MTEPYSTTAGVPTTGDCYAKLMHHIGEAEGLAAMMSHLYKAQDDKGSTLLTAKGWLGVSEQLRNMQIILQRLATKGFH